MVQSKSLFVLAGAALSLSAAGFAQAQQSNTNEDQIRAIVAEMQADAGSRSNLLAADAGYDEGFFITGDNGFRLQVGGLLQFRYIANFGDDDNTVRDDDFDPGFEMANTRLWFRGKLHDNWIYNIQGNFARDDESGSTGNFGLEDAFIGYEWDQDVTFYFGQFKVPFLREELVDEPYQLAIERSVTNEFFSMRRTQGVWMNWTQPDWNLNVAVHDGGGNNSNTPFNGSTNEGDFGVSGRFEYKFEGEWEQFRDFTSERGAPFAWMLGAAANYSQLSAPSGSNTNAIGDTDFQVVGWTVDLSFEGDGWNAFAAYMGDYVESRTAGADTDVTNHGFVAQVGFRVADDTELFGRWDAILVDDDLTTDDDNFHFLTFGVNQYYAGAAARATLDVVIALNETDELVGLASSPFPGGGRTGILGNSESGEVAVRFQLQLMF